MRSLALLFLFFLLQTNGNTAEKAQLEKSVREYLTITQAAYQFRYAIQKTLDDNPSKSVPPELKKLLALSDEELIIIMIPVYLEVLGADAIPAILDFIRSPAGREFSDASLRAVQGERATISPETESAIIRFRETPAGRVFFSSAPTIEAKMSDALKVVFERWRRT